jgi:hypothetical protein
MQITSFVIEGRMPVDIHMLNKILISLPGADPGFQVRGGALKKIAPSGGRRENVWGISCEKNHDFTPKNHIFSSLRGGGVPSAPTLDPPLASIVSTI